MNEGTRDTATRVVRLVAVAMTLGLGTWLSFALGMCTADGICGDNDSAARIRLAYGGALLGATGAGAALAAAIRPRRDAVVGGAVVALALMAYAVTQVGA